MERDIMAEVERIASTAWGNATKPETAQTEHKGHDHHYECDGCRIIARVLSDSPFYADGKYRGKPWHAEIVNVFTVEPKQGGMVYRVWIVGLQKSRSVCVTVRVVVEHWSKIKGKWVYG